MEYGKPVVRYGRIMQVVIGESALLVPVDHPRSYLNGEKVITSTVLSYDDETGRIETRNTIYVPA